MLVSCSSLLLWRWHLLHLLLVSYYALLLLRRDVSRHLLLLGEHLLMLLVVVWGVGQVRVESLILLPVIDQLAVISAAVVGAI